MIDSVLTESDAASVERATPAMQSRLARLRAVDWVPLLLLLLIVASFGLRFVWLNQPDDALIFDEQYYVNAARVILGWPVAQDAPYADAQAGLDPNTEHPPGAKLLMAASMRLFGDNGIGWRLPSVLFGTLSIPLLYGIVRLAGGTKAIALLATFLFAFDNLVLVHSRIATLDVFMVTFLLLGIYCYLARWPTLAGLALVAATLCKIGGIYGIGVLIVFEGLRFVRARIESERWQLEPLRPLLVTTIVYIVALP